MARVKNSRRKKKNAVAKKAQNQRTLLVASAVVVFVASLGYLLYLGLQPAEIIAGLVNFGRQTRGHDETIQIDFGELPPVGGTHNPVWQNCGIYNEPIDPEHAVHSLEHGAVWITYQPDLPAAEIAELQNFLQGQTYLLLSPYPGQRSTIVATAWSVQIELDSAFDDRLDEFVGRYRLGPTTPEPGAACTGGIGEPLA